MAAPIIYSILQYKHKLSLGESLNVGVIFYIPEINKIHLEIGAVNRIKSIYSDVDSSLTNDIIRLIKDNIGRNNNLFLNINDNKSFIEFLRQHILQEDATGLIFSEPVSILTSFNSVETTINEYSKLLLPQNLIKKPVIRHDEQKIIKDYFSFFKGEYKELENRFEKNVIIQTRHYNVKFDYKWVNGSLNYIKPLSFDLSDVGAINNKTAIFHSHLIELNDYFKNKNSRIDILLAEPQNPELKKEYDNALDIINETIDNKKIVYPNSLEQYFLDTVDGLRNH